MIKYNNIFCASNPSKILDALRTFFSGRDFSDDVVFLPSRRAVRAVEKMLARQYGATLLPKLVALGESDDNADFVSDIERTIIMARALSSDPNVGGMSGALTLAGDLVRLQDKMDEFGVTVADWNDVVSNEYAAHFSGKAKILNIINGAFGNINTRIKKRDKSIREWMDNLSGAERIIIACPNLSIPAVSELAEYIAGCENGLVLLGGNIRQKAKVKRQNECDPYVSQLRFLEHLDVLPSDVNIIDVGESNIEFFNSAFSDNPPRHAITAQHPSDGGEFIRIDCARESEEAEVVAEIAERSVAENKSVLIITPDAAGNQRIASAFSRRGLSADFSGGLPGTMTPIGRAILNTIDDLLEKGIRNQSEGISSVYDFIDGLGIEFSDDDTSIIEKLNEVSDILIRYEIVLSLPDLRAIVKNTLSGVSVRPPLNDDARIRVLGVIESRMQDADVVILTGLNEGMFPGAGYSNPWLPRAVADKIGLPSPDVDVSLTALDFITLSCADSVYWTRSKTAGGATTTESRFLSRVEVVGAHICAQDEGRKYAPLQSVRELDNIPYSPLPNGAPTPPADRSDVYVTDLELLIHNPYAYYAKHILKLRPRDDYWSELDARDFGNIVHKVIEELGDRRYEIGDIIAELDKRAMDVLGADNVIFHFWHKRFVEIVPEIQKLLEIKNAQQEIELETVIAGRRVRARADMVFDNVVMDIKTGSAPTESQLRLGNMPQLPLEAHMLSEQSTKHRAQITMQFLQLKNNDVKLIEYSGEIAQQMMDSAVQKASELFGRYSKDFEKYEYRETNDKKYQAWDDLARV